MKKTLIVLTILALTSFTLLGCNSSEDYSDANFSSDLSLDKPEESVEPETFSPDDLNINLEDISVEFWKCHELTINGIEYDIFENVEQTEAVFEETKYDMYDRTNMRMYYYFKKNMPKLQ